MAEVLCTQGERQGLMMKDVIAELVRILNEETEIYNELLSLSGEKTDIIVKGKVSELDSIVKKEQSLILLLGGLEGQREEVVDKIAKTFKINPAEISMTELVKRLDSTQMKELSRCQERLSSSINELKELNDINSKLVKNSLEFINFSINVLTSAGDTGNNYSNNGQVNDHRKRQIFDMKL